MPIPNRISAVLLQEDYQSVLTELDSIAAKLTLVDLNEKERESIIYVKEKNRGLIMSSLELAKKIPGFLPKNFDVAEFEKDAVLFDTLFSLKQAFASLVQRIEDTSNLAGNEAYAAALAVYSYAKIAGIGTEGIDPYLDEMARRFARKPRPVAESAK